jgi:hypothetical protein
MSTIDEISKRVKMEVFQELGNALVDADIQYSGQYPDLKATLRELGLELRKRAEEIANEIVNTG